jgi:hypothetical protein
MTGTITIMLPGRKYRLRYQLANQRKPREAVLIFLDEFGGQYHFSARPVAGTQSIEKEAVQHIEAAGVGEECFLNKIIKEA